MDVVSYCGNIPLQAWNSFLLHFGELVEGLGMSLVGRSQEMLAGLLHIFLHAQAFEIKNTHVVMAVRVAGFCSSSEILLGLLLQPGDQQKKGPKRKENFAKN